jgi:positive regulator of sigma E activity
MNCLPHFPLMLKRIFTKRWFGYFLLFFVVWFPVTTTLAATYQVIQKSVLIFAVVGFTIGYWLFLSYQYFKRARNDWTARLFGGVGWLVLMIAFSAALVEPFLGISWRSLLNVSAILGNWINLVAILVGALLAPRHPVVVGTLSERLQATSQQSSDLRPPGPA